MDDPGTEPSPPASEGNEPQGGHDHLEAAEAADDETRLKVLEDLYRSLESGLEGSGSPSSR